MMGADKQWPLQSIIKTHYNIMPGLIGEICGKKNPVFFIAYFASLWLIPHPTVTLTTFWTQHASMHILSMAMG